MHNILSGIRKMNPLASLKAKLDAIVTFLNVLFLATVSYVGDFIGDTRGERKIVDIVIGLFIAGIMLPAALVAIASGNYTGVDSSVKTIVTVLLPMLGVIAIAYVFLKKR